MSSAPAMISLTTSGRICAARTFCIAAFASAFSGCVAQPQVAQPDQWTIRLEALALIETLNSDLLSHDSATATLERWCTDHRLADTPRIVARRAPDAAKPIPDSLRDRLQISVDEPLAYRRVRLSCGTRVLSEADNWYVPSRLTEDMNRRLNSTDEPFGKVVKALDFQRRTLSAEMLWQPLPLRWETNATHTASEALHIPNALFRHQAVLSDAHQKPFSIVVETYTGETLAFGDLARFVQGDNSP